MHLHCWSIVLLAVVGCADGSKVPATPTDAGGASEEPAPTPVKAQPAPETLFDAMDTALADSDEPAFRALWHPTGYATNLVGGSGIAGNRVFAQGARKKWYLKPDLTKATKISDGVHIVPCDIWSREKQRAVDGVYALIVRHEERWVIVGAGEKRAQVDALADRFVKGEGLAPPADRDR